jgi:DNA-binding CsgD family transcriptional regulator
LTDREFAIFEMLGRGLSTRQIASNLFLSPKTVEKHRENIKNKLGIANTPKLIAAAARWVCRDHGSTDAKT